MSFKWLCSTKRKATNKGETMTPTDAYYKALKEGPSDLTRNIACQDAEQAYFYARNIDKKPSKQTRDAACQGPEDAYCYARYIDKKPSKQTRDAACQSPRYAYCYARHVDKEPLQETWKYVLNTSYEEEYTNWADEIENVDKHI